jgi:hypothetical protein
LSDGEAEYPKKAISKFKNNQKIMGKLKLTAVVLGESESAE